MKKLTFKLNNNVLTLNLLKNISKITILEACLSMGVYIPHFCYNKYLLIAGNCRICIVEIEKFIKPIISCLNLCVDNLNIFTNSFSLKKFRENVLEFLLINHPLDCPICDQGGECDLQDQTIKFGLDKSRFFFRKKVNSDIYLNSHIKLVLNRCILCVRCVRFLRETQISNEYPNLLGTIGRGSLSKIHLYTNFSDINLLGSSNIIDLCPVGALTSKYKQFVSRPWEYKSIISFDFADSFGLPVLLDFKNNEVVRVLPYLDSVFNLEFISDLTRISNYSRVLYNNVYELLNYPNVTYDRINYRLFKLFNLLRATIMYLPINPLFSFKNIKNIFKNLMGAWKYFDSDITFCSNFNNKYLLSINIIDKFKDLNLIFINKFFKNFMYRFFLYINKINKLKNNVVYIDNEDFNLLNMYDLNINEKILLFKDNFYFFSNNTKKIYIAKLLSFFKTLLNFDDVIFLSLKNINQNFKRAKKFIVINLKNIDFSLKARKNIHMYKFYNVDLDFDLIFNAFGLNINSNLKMLNYTNKIYRQDIVKILKKNVINY
jgi:hypothetical protein